MRIDALERIYRIQTGDTVLVKPLCSPEAFLYRLEEAQIEAARRAHLLVDSTSEVAVVDVAANTAIVDIDPRVIRLRRARLMSGSLPLCPIRTRELDDREPGWERAVAGVPRYVVVDWQTDALRLHPASKTADTLVQTVVREPLCPLTARGELEIAPRYHLRLLEWVKYRTYETQDPDNFDARAAEKALQEFTAEFGPAVGALNERWSFEQEYDIGEF